MTSSPSPIAVSKYTGLGNDFILAREADVAAAGIEPGDFARRVCDRHFGIGADGAILVGGTAAGGSGPLWMHYHNGDGSVAPMCGNGIRCLAAYCFDEGIATDEELAIETLAGTKVVRRVSMSPFRVRVDMGTPDPDPAACGITAASEPVSDRDFTLADGSHVSLTCVFMATAHAVAISADAMADANMVAGEQLCHDPFFPEQINVNFAQPVKRKRLLVRTYERGCGPTLACGTGACAAAVVAHEKGLVDASVDVRVPGGELHVDIADDGRVYMTGEATRVMRGAWYL